MDLRAFVDRDGADRYGAAQEFPAAEPLGRGSAAQAAAEGMMTAIWYVFLIALLALVAAAAYFLVRSYLNGTSPRAALFGPRPLPRLAVVDYANVDGRRRLILIRRDDTEHLIMTGGPVDVVIETGIAASEQPAASEAKQREDVVQRAAAQPVFARSPRTANGSGDSAAE